MRTVYLCRTETATTVPVHASITTFIITQEIARILLNRKFIAVFQGPASLTYLQLITNNIDKFHNKYADHN
jgi:hypothetical protein